MPRSADILRTAAARWSATATVVALSVMSATGASVGLQSQRPTFASTSEAVYVTATVIGSDGRLVTDLTARDFEVRDNGVVRDITEFRSDRVPFAIVIMVDISGSMPPHFGGIRRGVEHLVSRFEPGDRANIGTFAGMPVIGPRFTANPQALLRLVSASMSGIGVPCVRQHGPPLGWSNVWGAIECGIEIVATDGETPRRIVMVITDGKDNVRHATPTEVIRFAGRFGVTLFAVGIAGIEGLDGGTLRSVAEDSGGEYFQMNGYDDLTDVFARVTDQLRHQYVFGFTPLRSDSGKHNLQVRALRPGVTTRARRVYLETVPTPPIPETVNATGKTPAARPDDRTRGAAETAIKSREAAIESFERYERGDWAIPGSATRQDFDYLLRTAPSWIRARGPAHESRRRLASAGYLLELLMAHARDIALWQPGQFAASALEEACDLLRAGPVSPEELWWHAASIGLLEQVGVGSSLAQHLKHAESRFPHEGRWALARVVVEELQTWPERRDERRFSAPRELEARLTRAFTDAAAVEPLRPEIELRWGYFELRRGKPDAALAHFALVGAPADVVLRYWLHLFSGQAHEQAGRLKEAIALYEQAVAAVPAQSAAIALGAALVADRRPSEAAALMFRTLSLPPPPIDPWDLYLNPDARFLPLVIERLRKAIVQ